MSSIKLIPSRQSRLTAHYKQLTEIQKNAVSQIIEGKGTSKTLNELTIESRPAVIETLFDYYSFKSFQDRDEGPKDDVSANTKRELVLERLQLPASERLDVTEYNLRPPGDGPRPFLLRLGSIQNSTADHGIEFQFRSAYYDFLSLDLGRPKNSEVKVMDTTFVSFNNAIWLHKLDLISITTLNLSQTGLPGDGGWAWRFSTGFEKLNLACRDCDLFKIDGGYGKGVNLFDRLTIYALLNLRAQTPTMLSGQLAATPTIGAIIDWPGGVFKSEFSLGYRSYLESSNANSEILKIENRIGLSRNWDLRASYEKNVDQWYRLAVSLYL